LSKRNTNPNLDVKIKEHRTQQLSLRWKCYYGEVVTQDKMRSRL